MVNYSTWQFSLCRRASEPRRQLWADPCTFASAYIFLILMKVQSFLPLNATFSGRLFSSEALTMFCNSFYASHLFTCIDSQVQQPTDSQPHPPPPPALAPWDSTMTIYMRSTRWGHTGRRSFKEINLARKPWISWSGLNPHSPSKSVRAMAISGLW